MYINATAIFRDIFHFRLKNMTMGSNKKAVIPANSMGTETGMIKYAATSRHIIASVRIINFRVIDLFISSPFYH
ncbi:hypothetical protein LSP03_31550 [Lysinibacillus sphaericus]|nr:hypothetical protein LSP03_31550 [Lysinibacillus sphaericus]